MTASTTNDLGYYTIFPRLEEKDIWYSQFKEPLKLISVESECLIKPCGECLKTGAVLRPYSVMKRTLSCESPRAVEPDSELTGL